ncbi:MAG: alpha-ketoglutarate-dependent dioxygenase AlkB [Aquihabitans sp.]
MDPEAEIVTMSFGEVRRIQFRPIGSKPHMLGDCLLADPPKTAPPPGGWECTCPPSKFRRFTPETMWLGHGSAAVMAAGMQQVWAHRIPKSSRQGGERISLTFRRYRDPARIGASA